MLYGRLQCSVHVGLLGPHVWPARAGRLPVCVKTSITWDIPGVTLHVPHHQCQHTSSIAFRAAEPYCSCVCSRRSIDSQGPSTHSTHCQALYLLEVPCCTACAALGVEGSAVNAVTHASDDSAAAARCCCCCSCHQCIPLLTGGSSLMCWLMPPLHLPYYHCPRPGLHACPLCGPVHASSH